MNELPPLQAAPEWSLALGETGKLLVILALVLYVVAAVSYIISDKGPPSKIAKVAFLSGSFAFIGVAICLLILFLNEQWHFTYVFQHSASDHELQYKIAGVWSGQEGSFLLWGLTSAILGAFAARGAGKYRRWFTVVYSLFLAAIAGILAFESPFALQETFADMNLIVDGKLMMLPEGTGLSASLLNYWVVIHPPTIFTGFGALTVLFAYGMSALMQRDAVNWIPSVRPWAVFTLAILGIGLCMGGFWAYETLGWGGFWAWDPVENTSFVPWVLTLVFVHGMFVQQAKKKWHFANVLFALLPFLIFCYGTFLTRSGYLTETSVHSFAKMDSSALVLLIGLLLLAVASCVVAFAVNWPAIENPVPPERKTKPLPINRQSLYGTGAWLLFAFACITALGMSVPFLVTTLGFDTKIVDEYQYHSWLAYFYPPLMIAMAVAPFVGWNGARLRDVLNRVLNCVAISIGLIGCILLWMKFTEFPAPEPGETISFWKAERNGIVTSFQVPRVSWVLFLTWCSLFTAIAAFWRMIEIWKKSKSSVGGLLAHFGLALTLLGLIFSRGFERESEVMALHNSAKPAAFAMEFTNEGTTLGLGDRHNKLEIKVDGKDRSFTALPGIYAQPGAGDELSFVSWPYIKRYLLFDYYIAISKPYLNPTDPTVIPNSEDPQQRTVVFKDTALVYDELETIGTMGDGDAVLIANMTVVMPAGSFKIKPAIHISADNQINLIPEDVADTYKVYLVGVDPETHDITVQLDYLQPAYPMVVFFKPLTMFVWLGVGIMTLGGLIAAANRRKEKRAVDKALNSDAT